LTSGSDGAKEGAGRPFGGRRLSECGGAFTCGGAFKGGAGFSCGRDGGGALTDGARCSSGGAGFGCEVEATTGARSAFRNGTRGTSATVVAFGGGGFVAITSAGFKAGCEVETTAGAQSAFRNGTSGTSATTAAFGGGGFVAGKSAGFKAA